MITEVAAEVSIGTQVDHSAEQLLEFDLHAGDGQQARNAVWLELDEEIDVARWSEVPPKDRPERRDPSDRVATSKLIEDDVVHLDPRSQLHPSIIADGNQGPSDVERIQPGSNLTNPVRLGGLASHPA